MLTRIAGGEVYDPANKRAGVGDVWICDGVIAAPPAGEEPHRTIDAAGCVVMAGAIDIHSHIGGGNVNTARLLLPEEHRAHAPRPAGTPLSNAGWSTFQTGVRYAQMGFTTVVEPAMSPGSALHTHLELADIPIIDKASLAILGNDDFLLSMLRDDASPAMIDDYVAWTVGATRALGVKVINAGAAAAFKENVRSFALDDLVPSYGVSSRSIVKALQASVGRLGIAHPLHVHCNNLGAPGSADTAAATIAAAEGMPLHLAHLQFYGYGREGKRRFSSAAARLAELVNATPEITIDIGQVMFQQTVTVSSDVLRQFLARGSASPKKFVIHDGDGNGGGIVPYRYRGDFYGTTQWAVGLELFLLITDPWRVFFTTDHPNGAPFTAYPELFSLLMDRSAREAAAEGLSKAALALSTLSSIGREYSFEEIAVMTRAAPARLLGLADRGHLGPGAIADVAVYRKGRDIAAMFARAAFVFKDGELVVEAGEVTRYRWGRALRVRPKPEKAMVRRLDAYYQHATACRSAGSSFRTRRSPARARSRRCHAGPSRQRGRHRRHLCRGVRHAGDGDRHHRTEPQMGAPCGGLDDRLRHLRHRLRLRGGDRRRAAGLGDARRPARLPRHDLRRQHRGAAEAADRAGRPMRADGARQRLLCRPGSGQPAEARGSAALFRRRLPDLQKARRASLLAGAGDGRRVCLRGEHRHDQGGGGRGQPSFARDIQRGRRWPRPRRPSRRSTRWPAASCHFPGGIVRSGSKIGGKYKGMIASTNDAFAPTLRGLVKSELGPEVNAVLELVIDGESSQAVADAMQAGIAAVAAWGPISGALRISAGNYGGKLGKFLYHLKDLVP